MIQSLSLPKSVSGPDEHSINIELNSIRDMARDLREVINKIIVAVSDDEATPEQVAALASDLALFFDASVTLVYLGRLPLSYPLGENQAISTQIAAEAVKAIDQGGKKILDMMAESISVQGVPVSSRVVIGPGTHAIRDIIETEQADLVVLPNWGTGVTNRLFRLFSPSILEDASCPVLVLKGNRWQSKSKAVRPSLKGIQQP